MSKKFNIKPPIWPREYSFTEFAKLNPHIINENQLVSFYNQYLNKYLTELGEKKIHFKQSKITQLLIELKEFQQTVAIATPGAGYQYASRYSLEFDGLENEVTTAFSGSATPVSKTYSWWMKATETAQNTGVFGYGGSKKEAFTINASQSSMGKPLIKLGNHLYKFFMTPGYENQGGGTSGNSDSGATNNLHFEGSLDEFSIFGGDKTSKASTYYNRGRPYDVTNEADLQGYWKFENNANDSSGNGYHGTVDGATFSTSTPK